MMPNRNVRRVTRRTARYGSAHETGSGLIELARDKPLLVAGVGIAFGMALGALLPWDRIEDEFLGDQAEKLKDGALDLANDGYERVKSVAKDGYDAATEALSVNKSGLGGGESSLGSSSGPSSR